MSNVVYDATGAVVSNGAATAPVVPPAVDAPTTKPTTRLSTLSQIEKVVVWLVGLFSATVGALTAAKGLLPASVSTILVAILPVVLVIERYITGNAGS